MDDKIKGHLSLRKAEIDTYTKNMIVRAASGKYDVGSISNALRQDFRNENSKPTVTPGHNSTGGSRGRGGRRGRCGYRGRGWNGRNQDQNHGQETTNNTQNNNGRKRGAEIWTRFLPSHGLS